MDYPIGYAAGGRATTTAERSDGVAAADFLRTVGRADHLFIVWVAQVSAIAPDSNGALVHAHGTRVQTV